MHPNRKSSWTWTALVTLAVAVASPWVGCAPKAEFAAEAKYTPESLADELAFRLKEAGADAKALKKRGVLKADKSPAKETVEEQKKGEANKKQAAPASTADQILDETAEKIKELPGIAPAEACTRMAAALRKSTLLPDADREAVAKKLEQMAGK